MDVSEEWEHDLFIFSTIYFRFEHILYPGYFKHWWELLSGNGTLPIHNANTRPRLHYYTAKGPAICTTCGYLRGWVENGICLAGCARCNNASGSLAYTIQQTAWHVGISPPEAEHIFAWAGYKLTTENWKRRYDYLRNRHKFPSPKLETLVAQFRANAKHVSSEVSDL